MSPVVEVRVSPCPNCGQNRWLMEVSDDVAKKTHAKPAEPTAGQVFHRGAGTGFVATVGGFLDRFLFWKWLTEPGAVERRSPTTTDAIVCANCGHQMSLGQSGEHDWHLT